MHYIEYVPGTIARITTHPTNIGSKDVNLLSMFVCKFNAYVKLQYEPWLNKYRAPSEDFYKTLQERARINNLLLPT